MRLGHYGYVIPGEHRKLGGCLFCGRCPTRSRWWALNSMCAYSSWGQCTVGSLLTVLGGRPPNRWMYVLGWHCMCEAGFRGVSVWQGEVQALFLRHRRLPGRHRSLSQRSRSKTVSAAQLWVLARVWQCQKGRFRGGCEWDVGSSWAPPSSGRNLSCDR